VLSFSGIGKVTTRMDPGALELENHRLCDAQEPSVSLETLGIRKLQFLSQVPPLSSFQYHGLLPLSCVCYISNLSFSFFCFGFLFVCLFCLRSCYVSQAGLELKILLPQPPDCWNYRSEPLCPALQMILKKDLSPERRRKAPPPP
jgi:hypothetical protein